MKNILTSKQELTMGFQTLNIDSLASLADRMNSIKSDMGVEFVSQHYNSLSDVFESFQLDGNYKILELCVRFMNNLWPVDIYMFFDEFNSIEEHMFLERCINFQPVQDAYTACRHLIETNYINFILEFYPECVKGLLFDVSTYSKEQIDFIICRNMSMMELLPTLGTKISGEHYVDIVVDDTSRFNR